MVGSRRRVRSRTSKFPPPSGGTAQSVVRATSGNLPSSSVLSRALLVFIATVAPSAVKGDISSYYASNCYEVGGGNMGPLHLQCNGCQYVEAFACLNILRTNASANVPYGCGINTLTVQPDPTCCAIFKDPGSLKSVDTSTSAYPDAILCLEGAGCTGANLHTALVAECKFQGCSEEFSCAAAYSSSRRLSPTLRVITLAWVVAKIALIFFVYGE